MKKAVVLNSVDVSILGDVLEYHLCLDDREENDFIKQYGDKWFDKQGELILNIVSMEARSHIFFKMSYLKQQFDEVS